MVKHSSNPDFSGHANLDPQTGKRRVAIVEDHPLSRQGLAQLINNEDDLVVCGEAGNTSEAWQVLEATRPELVIVDISLRQNSGLDLVKNLRTRYPQLPVLILSMHDELLYAERSLRAGAGGYIMKSEAPDQVRLAIRHVLNGGVFLSLRASEKIARRVLHRRNPDTQDPVIDLLSDRELEIFQLIGLGHTAKEIAGTLNVSAATVNGFRARIKEKLGLKSGAELAYHAHLWVHEQGED